MMVLVGVDVGKLNLDVSVSESRVVRFDNTTDPRQHSSPMNDVAEILPTARWK